MNQLIINYLNTILTRYNAAPTLLLLLTPTYSQILPILQAWAGTQHLLEIKLSGSNAKGTAIGFSDLDFLISFHSNILGRLTLAQLYNSLAQFMANKGYAIRRQNVSVRVNHNGIEVDIVPAVKFSGNSNDHWLHITKSGRDRTKTNIDSHINRVINSGRTNEIRLTKIWRKINNLDFPSIYLEETVISALLGCGFINLDDNFLRVLDYISNSFVSTSVYDPANSANRISDDLTMTEKATISYAGKLSRALPTWGDIIW